MDLTHYNQVCIALSECGVDNPQEAWPVQGGCESEGEPAAVGRIADIQVGLLP